MPQLSSLINQIKPSATLELNSMAAKLRSQGAKVYNLSVGEPDYRCDNGTLLAGISSMCNDPIKYGSAGGGIDLRAAIVEKFKQENQLDFTVDEVVCGVGAKQVLFHLMQILLDSKDQVLVHKPAWTSYVQQIISAKADPVLIPYFCSDSIDDLNAQAYDPEYIDSFVSDKTKAILLCSPNNPCGYALSKENLIKLGQYLLDKDWWIICDEIYEYFNFDEPHLSLLNLFPKLKDRIIIVNGVSKSFAMTGWRMGYLAANEKVAKGVKALISHSSTCLPVFVEKAATWTINHGKSLMTEQIDQIRKKRDLALSIVSTIDDLKYVKPQGAFYIFCDVKKLLKSTDKYDDNDSMQLSLDLLKKHHVSMVPGEGFSTPGYLRLSYACSKQDIISGLDKFKQFVKTL